MFSAIGNFTIGMVVQTALLWEKHQVVPLSQTYTDRKHARSGRFRPFASRSRLNVAETKGCQTGGILILRHHHGSRDSLHFSSQRMAYVCLQENWDFSRVWYFYAPQKDEKCQFSGNFQRFLSRITRVLKLKLLTWQVTWLLEIFSRCPQELFIADASFKTVRNRAEGSVNRASVKHCRFSHKF